MPLYEYCCKKCKLRFDVRRRVDDRNKVAECECSGPGFRVFSVPQKWVGAWNRPADPRNEEIFR